MQVLRCILFEIIPFCNIQNTVKMMIVCCFVVSLGISLWQKAEFLKSVKMQTNDD